MAKITVGVLVRAVSKLSQSHSPQKIRKFIRLMRNGDQRKICRDVPKGHCAVYVGEHRSRFIVPTSFLSHSLFADLLQKSADEFGFDHHLGIVIPCDERLFEQLTSVLSIVMKKKNNNKPFYCRIPEFVLGNINHE